MLFRSQQMDEDPRTPTSTPPRFSAAQRIHQICIGCSVPALRLQFLERIPLGLSELPCEDQQDVGGRGRTLVDVGGLM